MKWNPPRLSDSTYVRQIRIVHWTTNTLEGKQTNAWTRVNPKRTFTYIDQRHENGDGSANDEKNDGIQDESTSASGQIAPLLSESVQHWSSWWLGTSIFNGANNGRKNRSKFMRIQLEDQRVEWVEVNRSAHLHRDRSDRFCFGILPCSPHSEAWFETRWHLWFPLRTLSLAWLSNYTSWQYYESSHCRERERDWSDEEWHVCLTSWMFEQISDLGRDLFALRNHKRTNWHDQDRLEAQPGRIISHSFHPWSNLFRITSNSNYTLVCPDRRFSMRKKRFIHPRRLFPWRFLPRCIECSRRWATSHIHRLDIRCHYVGNHTYRTCDRFVMDIDYTSIIDIHCHPGRDHVGNRDRITLVNIVDRLSLVVAHYTSMSDNRCCLF